MEKPRLKILLAMLLVMAVVVGYALYPKPLHLDVTLKQAKLPKVEAPAKPKLAQRAAARADSARRVAAVAKKPLLPDTARQRILFIGDSMLDGLAPRLAGYAEANGYSYYCVIWYGSSTQSWATTRTLEHFVQQVKPTYLLISLGGNELFVRDLDERDQYIKTLVKKIGDLPYIWIGPPNWKPDTGINKLILANVGKDHFFDSSHLTLERRKDHAHPTPKAAAHWFDLVAKWMETDCAHPLRMKVPVKKSPLRHVEILGMDAKGY